MTTSLPHVAHEHHERLIHTVDTLPALGDALMTGSPAELKPRIAETDTFLTTLLVPHLEAAERTLYPELERMLQNRHSMTPMRKEHQEIRSLVADFHRLGGQIEAGESSLARTLAVRRIVFRLYALLKVHLVEEELYVGIVNKGVTADVAEILAAGLEHPVSDAR
jgi:hemerythrin-like domain-containing protein